MPYLVCEKCRGYYELQEGESKDEFEFCQCGGNLKYINSIEDIDEPKNNAENPKKPWLAGLLSLILPGLGHFYARNIYIGFIGLGLFILWLFMETYYPPPYPWPAFVPGAIELVIYTSIAGHAFWIAKKANRGNIIMNEVASNSNMICPDCGAENTKNMEYCVNCGRDLRKTIFYACGDVSIINASDIEITENLLIEYKKGILGKKRSGKIKEYYLNEMGYLLINDRMQRLCSPFPFPYISLEFDYGEHRKSVYIPEDYVDNLIETLNFLNIPYEDYYHFRGL